MWRTRSISIPALALLLLAMTIAPVAAAPVASASPAPNLAGQPDFGPNVIIFDPSMSTSQIQAKADAIYSQMVDNEMGSQRYALLFKPGTYGSAAQPLIIKVGYYTEVAGLGASPTDVTINGHVDVYNRCLDGNNNCIALVNFWRSLSNLTIKVESAGLDGCRASGDFWAVSQAAPMRRVNVTGGNLTLMDYCSGPSFASGGFIADTQTQFIINGSQQQFLVRNSSVGGWSNAVWNQAFSGVLGAPPQSFPDPPYTTLDSSPATTERPFLYVDSSGNYNVFVPVLRSNSSGTSWSGGPADGASIPLSAFFIATPTTPWAQINAALATGKNLLLTPGIYELSRAIDVKRPDTVVLGLGLPSLVPTNGNAVLTVANVKGTKLAGFLVDAGEVNSPVLLQVGMRRAEGTPAQERAGWSDPADPSSLHDVFFRIGGARVGKATTTLQVNSDNVVLDDIWAWRADHGKAGTVGWTINTADTGVVVNGDNVIAYGLFVEHYQKYETIWNGNGGKVIFFQNEMPYDPPSQDAWMEAPDVKGWPAFKVADSVTSFNGYAMGSYSFFNQGIDIYAAHAFEVPTTLPAGSLRDLLTIFLDPANGKGGILHVVNDAGGSSTIANPDVVVPVVSYP